MTMGDPNGTDGKSLDEGGDFMDSEDEEEVPPNAGARGQGTTGGTEQASGGTQGPSSSGTQGVVAVGGQGTLAGGVSAPPSVTSSVQGSEQMPLQTVGKEQEWVAGKEKGRSFRTEW